MGTVARHFENCKWLKNYHKMVVWVVRQGTLGFVVLAACTHTGDALRFVSAALHDDRDVVLAACTQNGEALRFASAALQDDRDVVLAACNQCGDALRYASAALKADRGVLLAACNQSGYALEFASAALKDDRDVVLAACNQDALEFASNHKASIYRPKTPRNRMHDPQSHAQSRQT